MCASGRLVVCGRGHLELRDRGIGLCGARVWKLECRPAKGPGIPRVLRDTCHAWLCWPRGRLRTMCVLSAGDLPCAALLRLESRVT